MMATIDQLEEVAATNPKAGLSSNVSTAATSDGEAEEAHGEEPSRAAGTSDMWRVVGGSAKGGIVVRVGKTCSSRPEAERLATHSLVRAMEQEGVRLRYKLISGSGPATGWVTVCLDGKDLLTKVVDEAQDSGERDRLEALAHYGHRFGRPVEGEATFGPGYSKKAFKWDNSGMHLGRPNNEVRAELERSLGRPSGPRPPAAPAPPAKPGKLQLEDFDGEPLELCAHCHLPLGDKMYSDDSKKTLLHGECVAQFMLHRLNGEEAKRQEQDLATKKSTREAYGIGWQVEHIPDPALPWSKLECKQAVRGMCCLVLERGGNSVRVSGTSEPAAAVNLEYLSTALEVKRREGREPYFSLDPLDNSSRSNMQEKRFEPEWLAGTKVGEVLFQADYHLKELSMGEYEQPVVGMTSCLDAFIHEDRLTEWNAREWFVVKDANIFLSADNALVPYIKMGVEAREQLEGPDGLEDAPITRADHPLVKYAEVFTRNFDLIAERKSVVFHLRELAKASILAKYLLESRMNLEDSWFHLAGEALAAYPLEVPQLWNERIHSEIQVEDGKVLEADSTKPRMHGVYGGVQFGLDKFTVGARAASASVQFARVGARGPMPRVSAALSMATSVSGGLRTPAMRAAVSMRAGGVPRGVQFGLDKFTVGARAASASVQFARVGARGPMPRVSAALSMATSVTGGLRTPAMRGVDLSLDSFDLSEHCFFQDSTAMTTVDAPEGCTMIGEAFWSVVDDGKLQVFEEEDAKLLKSVFNASMSDRRMEGELFTPPETSFGYIERLRALVKQEEIVQDQRKRHFLNRAFMQENPGPLFPSSWRASFQIAEPQKAGALHPRPDFQAHAEVFEKELQSAEPTFNKLAEDGTRFRIYRIGDLEVRTTQATALGEKETVGAVFSSKAPPTPPRVLMPGMPPPLVQHAQPQMASPEEKIIKARMYVEKGKDCPFHCYAVLETQAGRTIMTERLANGVTTWEENSQSLEVRSSLAKELRSMECHAGVTAGDMKQIQGASSAKQELTAGLYAKCMCSIACRNGRLHARHG